VVPPPALRGRSGISAFLSASTSSIERLEPSRLLVFGPSPPCAGGYPASADFWPSTLDGQTSRGKTRDFHPIHPPHLRPTGPGGIGLRVCLPPRPPSGRLLCGSRSSGRGFACSFLPTAPHDVAVAVRLGVPATKAPRGLSPPSHFPVRFRSPVESASHGAARHARRTKEKPRPPWAAGVLSNTPANRDEKPTSCRVSRRSRQRRSYESCCPCCCSDPTACPRS